MGKKKNNDRKSAKKPQEQKFTKFDSEEKKEDYKKGKGANDPSWYGANPQLIKSAASFPYSWPIGYPIRRQNSTNFGGLSWGSDGGVIYNPDTMSAPGVMALRFTAVPGRTLDNFSAINMAARNVYSWIRHENSGHANYDPVDLMLYLYAMDSVYSCYYWMVRLYGLLGLYSYENKYLPKTLIQANGVNFEDLMAHRADFKFFLDQYAVKIGSFCVPSSMPLYARHTWMHLNVFKDENVAKAQNYMFVPTSFWRYVETEGAGKLIEDSTIPIQGNLTTEQIIGMAQRLVDAVATSEDIGIMSGDVLKAFGSEGIVRVVMIPNDYVTIPEHNPEALSQIQNCTLTNAPLVHKDITQNTTTGALIYEPEMSTDDWYRVGTMNRIVNMYKQDVTPEDTMVATRLMFGCDPNVEESDQHPRIITCGTEIVSEVYIYGNIVDPEGETTTVAVPVTDPFIIETSSITPTALVRQIMALNWLSQFDYHPCVTYIVGNSNDGLAYYGGTQFDIGNYTTLSAYDLDKMHATALISEFDIPRMGTYAIKTE